VGCFSIRSSRMYHKMHVYVLRSRRLRSDRARDTDSEWHEAAMFWQHISKCLGYVCTYSTYMYEANSTACTMTIKPM